MTERALSGRRIMVLGGTGGLGRAVVERLRADGASVLVAGAKIPVGRHPGAWRAVRRDAVSAGD
jgi:NAD(P)-dependent dehydrogenase (short-subunit alcohol dehydrogenase family)